MSISAELNTAYTKSITMKLKNRDVIMLQLVQKTETKSDSD